MAPIAHQLNRLEREVLPEWKDELPYGTSFWLVGSTGRGTRDHRVMRGGRMRPRQKAVAINHLYLGPPLAFELYQPLIAHADIAKVIVANAKSACLLDGVPVEQVLARGLLIGRGELQVAYCERFSGHRA